MSRLNASELATVLAALRNWQHVHPDGMVPERFLGHFEDCEVLAHSEIDALCERLNCEPDEPDDAVAWWRNKYAQCATPEQTVQHREMIRDLAATLENVMLHLGKHMSLADFNGRAKLVNEARELVGR